MASSSTTQRLLRELKDYTKSPNEALLHLGPVDEDDLLHWEAVLKGVKGTPYEGTSPIYLPVCLQIKAKQVLTRKRRPLVLNHHPPPELPPITAANPFPDAHLAPQYLLHHWRNLSHAVDQRALESRVYALDDADGDSAAVDGSAAGFAVECGCGGAVEGWGCRGVGECGEVLDGGGEVGWLS